MLALFLSLAHLSSPPFPYIPPTYVLIFCLKKADSFLSWGLHMSPFPRPYLLKHLLHHSTFCSNVTTSKRFSLLDYCSTKIPHITMSFLLYPILFPFLSLISNLNCHSLFVSLTKMRREIFLYY